MQCSQSSSTVHVGLCVPVCLVQPWAWLAARDMTMNALALCAYIFTFHISVISRHSTSIDPDAIILMGRPANATAAGPINYLKTTYVPSYCLFVLPFTIVPMIAYTLYMYDTVRYESSTISYDIQRHQRTVHSY